VSLLLARWAGKNVNAMRLSHFLGFSQSQGSKSTDRDSSWKLGGQRTIEKEDMTRQPKKKSLNRYR
jgi:hypothetical protein